MTKEKELKKMTLTVQGSKKINLYLAGEGTFTIEWGDENPSETFTLVSIDNNNWLNEIGHYKFSHAYKDNSIQIINIVSEKITHLRCDNFVLSSLDISRNAELTHLALCANQLENIDISNNIALKFLHCVDNQLTSLDVSKYFNQIISLNVKKNEALKDIYCEGILAGQLS